jgi:hypothetical protein
MELMKNQQNQKNQKNQKKKEKKEKKKQNQDIINQFVPPEPKYNTDMFSPQQSSQPTHSTSNNQSSKHRRSTKMRVTPPKHKIKHKGPRSSSGGCIKFLMFLLILTGIAFFVTVSLDDSITQKIIVFFSNIFTKTSDPPKVKIVTPMTDVFPSPECIKVGRRQLQRMKSNMDEWENMDHSLFHHLINKKLGVISAFRIGLPYCYTLVRMPGNNTLRMLNPEIIAFSIDKVTSPKEMAYNCMDVPRWIKRSDDIVVAYNDPLYMDRKLLHITNQTAWAFQHEYIYNHSFDVCKGEDRGIDILQDMFFADKQKNLKKLNQ